MPGVLSGAAKEQRHPLPLGARLTNVMPLTPTPTSSAVSEVGSSEEIRSLDCNLGALCEHVQIEGWNAGTFSDITVHTMGSIYHLHRLILSRSSVFRNMLQGPWKEAGASEVTLQIDDENVNGEAVAIALAYLYGHHPKLNDSNAFRVLAAASFLDLQDLCAICTEFIISEIWTENFLSYQAFAESQDYGIHGERVRKACWGYLCRGGAVELKEILPKLSTQTLRTLLTSDELWVLSEEKRFELALSVFISRGALLDMENCELIDPVLASVGGDASSSFPNQSKDRIEELIDEKLKSSLTLQRALTLGEDSEGLQTAHKIILELADAVVEFCNESACQSTFKREQGSRTQQSMAFMYAYRSEKPGSPNKSQIAVDIGNICRPLIEIGKSMEASTAGEACSSHDGHENDYFSSHVACYDMASFRDQPQNCSTSQLTIPPPGNRSPNQWFRDGSSDPPLAWGGRVVGRRQMKAYLNKSEWENNDDWDAFLSVFEGGGILYCHMAFGELLHVRARLEEFGFPCKAVSDGLWLQTLLKQHVLTIAADTCNACNVCVVNCTCKQSYGYSHGRVPPNVYREDQDRSPGVVAAGVFHPDTQTVVKSAPSVQGRVHVRGPVDGLAGIGRGPPFGPPGGTWPPSRFMFNRIPFSGFGNRRNQQNAANDHSDGRLDINGMEVPGHSADGLPAVVGLSQGNSGTAPLHSNQVGNSEDQHAFGRPVGESSRLLENTTLTSRNVESEHAWAHEWETNESIPLDLDTPLRTFPPFRFGVEFDNVHRLADGQSKHSSESFYAGSLWKISVQAFHDEDPQGRRTLGLFLHRRRAENVEAYRKVHLYTDNREKVTARYQLICPAKRESMTFGSLSQAGTLLPKSPKGWGWRTAFLFDELADLLQGVSLRVAAVVQLV